MLYPADTFTQLPSAASQAEMTTGTEPGLRLMSPLNVTQAVNAILAAGITVDGGQL